MPEREIVYITNNLQPIRHTASIAEAVQHRLDIDACLTQDPIQDLQQRVQSLSLIVAKLLDHPSVTDSQIINILDFMPTGNTL